MRDVFVIRPKNAAHTYYFAFAPQLHFFASTIKLMATESLVLSMLKCVKLSLR